MAGDRIETNNDGPGSVALGLGCAHLREAAKYFTQAKHISVAEQGAPAVPANLETGSAYGCTATMGDELGALVVDLFNAVATGGTGENQINWTTVGRVEKGLSV